MRFKEFKIETVDKKNRVADIASLGPGEELLYGKKKLTPKVGTPSFQVKVPGNQYISTDVADIQKVLKAFGYHTLGTAGPHKDGIDGVNGQMTRSTLRQFQRDFKLHVDGEIGPETVEQLNTLLSQNPDVHITPSTDADLDRHATNVVNKVKNSQITDADIADIHDPEFNGKLKEVAGKLKVDPQALWKIIKFESDGIPSKQNPFTKATGLIQFMPKTAIGLGTSIEDLASMSAIDQLDYVYKFYKNTGLRPGSSVVQMYLKTVLPAFSHEGDDFVVGKQGAKKEFLPGVQNFSLHDFWKQNPTFQNKSTGVITLGDIKNAILGKG